MIILWNTHSSSCIHAPQSTTGPALLVVAPNFYIATSIVYCQQAPSILTIIFNNMESCWWTFCVLSYLVLLCWLHMVPRIFSVWFLHCWPWFVSHCQTSNSSYCRILIHILPIIPFNTLLSGFTGSATDLFFPHSYDHWKQIVRTSNILFISILYQLWAS